MERKTEKDADGNTDRSLFARVVEAVIVFAICCFLVRWGVEYVLAVKIPLLIIAAIIGLAVIIWRVYKWRHHDDY